MDWRMEEKSKADGGGDLGPFFSRFERGMLGVIGEVAVVVAVVGVFGEG